MKKSFALFFLSFLFVNCERPGTNEPVADINTEDLGWSTGCSHNTIDLRSADFQLRFIDGSTLKGAKHDIYVEVEDVRIDGKRSTFLKMKINQIGEYESPGNPENGHGTIESGFGLSEIDHRCFDDSFNQSQDEAAPLKAGRYYDSELITVRALFNADVNKRYEVSFWVDVNKNSKKDSEDYVNQDMVDYFHTPLSLSKEIDVSMIPYRLIEVKTKPFSVSYSVNETLLPDDLSGLDIIQVLKPRDAGLNEQTTLKTLLTDWVNTPNSYEFSLRYTESTESSALADLFVFIDIDNNGEISSGDIVSNTLQIDLETPTELNVELNVIK